MELKLNLNNGEYTIKEDGSIELDLIDVLSSIIHEYHLYNAAKYSSNNCSSEVRKFKEEKKNNVVTDIKQDANGNIIGLSDKINGNYIKFESIRSGDYLYTPKDGKSLGGWCPSEGTLGLVEDKFIKNGREVIVFKILYKNDISFDVLGNPDMNSVLDFPKGSLYKLYEK